LTLSLLPVSLWWILASPLPYLLLYTGVQQRRAADEVLFDSLRAGRIESPVLTTLDAQMQPREARSDSDDDGDDGMAGVGAPPKP
jgi:hypothetical protein